ncbi:DNA repair protein XRCC1 [Anastrepha ludens]|uniref:DNA repair protein XRCC1 n=1 Tax=Anastrepha ludens TaxID=28586 RepID=UPI0023B04E80|nr:DNA repair protein XRCC1 [Anastrepha ludens]
MPFANFKSVREVSSEDCKYPAENLLKQPSKKWKTKSVGERLAYVILELNEPQTITGIDIGNEHSAFIEVLVSKTSCNAKDFTDILVTCSFMTLIESKNSTNPNRVRCFNKDALVSTAGSEKWQFIKIICTQPFNKHIQYGISFIKIHVESDIEKSKVSIAKVSEPKGIGMKNSSASLNTSSLGIFKLREESPESDSEISTSLFKRWKASELSDIKHTPQESVTPRKPSCLTYNSDRIFNACSSQSVKPNQQKDEEDLKNRKSPQCLDRNRQDLAFGNEEKIVDEEVRKKRQRLSESIELEREQMRPKNDNLKIQKENKKAVLTSTQLVNVKSPVFDNKIISNTKNKGDACSKKDVKDRIYRLFNQLLKGTVLVISGIQNPDRSNLRDMALAMGAKYRADWESGCTHLICAFKNTPKYNQVKGKGKIVTRSWIEDCNKQKKCLPWRRYALNGSDLNQPESEEEVLDESLRPNALPVVKNNSKNVDVNTTDSLHSARSSNEIISTISSGSDTEDDIERVLQNKRSHCTAEANETRSAFDASTEEEDFLAKKVKIEANLKGGMILKGLVFFICEDITSAERKIVENLIKTNGGTISFEMNEAQYLISNGLSTDKIRSKYGSLVKPDWIYECNDMEIKVPINKYLCK